MQALQEIMETIRAVKKGNHHSRMIVLLAALDVRNAFYSARWVDMIGALKRFKVLEHLLRIIESYLSDRVLTYETVDGTRSRQIKAGAAQESILGPDLLNISYDDILPMDMPEGTYLSGYADDIVAFIAARDTEKIQWKLNQVMRRVDGWMQSHGLELAMQKAELTLITGKRIPKVITMQVAKEEIKTKMALKHLGIMMDTKLTFWDHVRMASDEVETVTMTLSRLMAHVNGPRSEKRRLLMTVAQSILLYGSEVWADALKKKTYRKRIAGDTDADDAEHTFFKCERWAGF